MNNYHIYDEIGRGKHSVVYKGRRKKSIDYLAVKSTEKSRRKKILNEVLIMHSLDHQNVLKFYNWYETRNHLWIIFQYCPGGSLLTLIEQDTRIPESAIRDFALDLLCGLYYLHSNGIIYGDLKPSNIYFTEFGVIKLGDFGLARRVIDLQSEPHAKRGTPFYMAPELFQDDGVYSYFSDFWSLGCVLFELATGQPPFVSSGVHKLLELIINSKTPVAGGCSDEFNQLLEALLQKQVWKRITWDELVRHPFWRGRARIVPDSLPPQPLYEKYLRDNGVQKAQVDVMRVSINMQRNLLRDSLQAGYKQTDDGVELRGTDQVVDLGEENEEEEAPSEVQERPATIQAKSREEDRPAHQRTNSAASKSAQFTPAPLDQLVIHSTDIAVKPIVGNRDIQKPCEITFNPQGLGAPAWSREDLVSKVQSKQMEEHFHKLYTLIASATSSAERLNTLNYFQSIIVSSSVANKLINSAFIDLLLKLLRMGKSSPLKARVCSILGTMIRHSTLISSELALSGIFQVLSEQLRDKNENVKRKSMAALGEYLFYAATQMDEEDSIWDIPNPIIALVIRACKPGDDQIFRFYATKTVQNITAQSNKAGLKFAIPEVARFLGTVYTTSKLEVFRASAALALSHITRLNTEVFEAILEKVPFRQMALGISEDSARMQQGLLTMLLLVLQAQPVRMAQLVADDPSVIPAVLKLIEHSAIVVRGKALLFCHFLIKAGAGWLPRLVEHKFLIILEKVMRDAYKFVQSCLHHLLTAIAEFVLAVLRDVQGQLTAHPRSGQLAYLQVVAQVVASGAGRSKLNYQVCLKYLSDILQLAAGPAAQQVLAVIEALSAHPRVLVDYAEAVIAGLLPLLLAQYASQDVGVRFRALKIFSDVLFAFLFEEAVYDPQSEYKGTTRLLNELLVKQLVPMYQDLLVDQEPVPLYALKLLSAVLERSLGFVSIVRRQGLLPLLLENFEGGNSKLNLHLVVIIKRVIESREIALEELVAMGIVRKVNSVMRLTLQQDWCVQHMLDILYELLGVVGESRGVRDEGLAANLTICVALMKNCSEKVHIIQTVAEKCALCIGFLLQIYGNTYASGDRETVGCLVEVLAGGRPALQRCILRIARGMRNFDCPSQVVQRLRGAEDLEVQGLSRELWP